MKLLDFRRYIFANLAALSIYILVCTAIFYAVADFPSPVLSNIGLEPSLVASDEEQKYINALFIIFGFMYLFFCLFVFEFFIKLLVFLIKKFIFKKTNTGKIKNGKGITKTVCIIYSVIFYIGFVASALLSFGILFEALFP